MVHHKLAIYITSDRCHDRRNLLALIQEKNSVGAESERRDQNSHHRFEVKVAHYKMITLQILNQNYDFLIWNETSN